MTATLALPAAVRGRSAALSAAAFDALAAATFLRCAVLLAVDRFFGAAVAPSVSSSRWASLTLAISRLLRRAALFGG